MKKNMLLSSVGLALAFTAILCSAINVASAYNMWAQSIDPNPYPDAFGCYVVAAVAGSDDGYGHIFGVSFWSCSYCDFYKGGFPWSDLYYEWAAGGYGNNYYDSGWWHALGIKSGSAPDYQPYGYGGAYSIAYREFWSPKYGIHWAYSAYAVISIG